MTVLTWPKFRLSAKIMFLGSVLFDCNILQNLYTRVNIFFAEGTKTYGKFVKYEYNLICD